MIFTHENAGEYDSPCEIYNKARNINLIFQSFHNVFYLFIY